MIVGGPLKGSVGELFFELGRRMVCSLPDIPIS